LYRDTENHREEKFTQIFHVVISLVPQHSSRPILTRLYRKLKGLLLETLTNVCSPAELLIVFKVCPPVLNSITDRVPDMDENWTFDTCSGLYTKEGA
jgi:hypothetical protein